MYEYPVAIGSEGAEFILGVSSSVALSSMFAFPFLVLLSLSLCSGWVLRYSEVSDAIVGQKNAPFVVAKLDECSEKAFAASAIAVEVEIDESSGAEVISCALITVVTSFGTKTGGNTRFYLADMRETSGTCGAHMESARDIIAGTKNCASINKDLCDRITALVKLKHLPKTQ